MRVFLLLAMLAIVLFAADQPLDNQAIIKLHNAGFSDETILQIIATQPGHYSAAVGDVIALKQAGIPEKIIRALVAKAAPQPVAPVATPTPGLPVSPSSTPAPAPAVATSPAAESAAPAPTATPQATATPLGHRVLTEIFYMKDDQWITMQAEPVSWKAGGLLKSVASAGAVKRDINGSVEGASSKNVVKLPGQFVLYIPGGVDIREYQLLHLHSRGGVREFRAAITDDFHVSGGRDLVPFETNAKPVTRHGFLITLKDLTPGEYGWVPPEAALSAHDPTVPPGKIFTFVVQ
jgi:hypothetical protein